ncbi:MAG: hypothetical protein ACRDFS_11270 [Chloroflexota bacterium]
MTALVPWSVLVVPERTAPELMQDQNRFRRHKGGCPYYRENWSHGEEQTRQGDMLLYEVYCLKGWPPQSKDEEESCLCSDKRCWRNGESHRVTPEQSARIRDVESA